VCVLGSRCWCCSSALAVPPLVTPPLGPGLRVFPVFGVPPPADTFGAARDDVSGGWHHGDDIFAPLGTPVLACAGGTVFSVGWNRIGGWRLWLLDRDGNEFYYAHLSGYSAFAVDGALVHAGDVLGFVGRSGDARTTPAHIDFEIHPRDLLPLGYDGAVDPTRYLHVWRRIAHIPARAAAGWSSHGGSPERTAGAVLLSEQDISSLPSLGPQALKALFAAAGTPPSRRISARARGRARSRGRARARPSAPRAAPPAPSSTASRG